MLPPDWMDEGLDLRCEKRHCCRRQSCCPRRPRHPPGGPGRPRPSRPGAGAVFVGVVWRRMAFFLPKLMMGSCGGCGEARGMEDRGSLGFWQLGWAVVVRVCG